MSKTKSVTPTQIEEMKAMVISGVQPQKIANKFGIGISTVHNYKKQFKEEGLQFESVRGRQAINKPSGLPRSNVKNLMQEISTPIHNNTQLVGSNTFVINGTTIQISNLAKSVNIEKNNENIVFSITI